MSAHEYDPALGQVHPVRRTLAALLLTCGTVLGAGASAASAHEPSPQPSSNAEPTSTPSAGQAALAQAGAQAGKPYQWGAAGPDRFDCSGFTQFLFAQQGVSLPHSSSAQYDAVAPIPRGEEQPGDLIFTYDSDGGIYHVGLYEGDGVMWAATKSGDVVRQQEIWTSQYKVGRV